MDSEIVKALAKQMSAAVREYVGRSASSLEARIKALEQSQIKYAGVWKEGDCYHGRDIVTHGGCLWHCQVPETGDRPGTTDSWRLMQKNR